MSEAEPRRKRRADDVDFDEPAWERIEPQVTDQDRVAVTSWLNLLGLPQYSANFLKAGYSDLQVWPSLGRKELEQIGVRAKDRGYLLRQNRKLLDQKDHMSPKELKDIHLVTQAVASKKAKKEAWLRVLILKRDEKERRDAWGKKNAPEEDHELRMQELREKLLQIDKDIARQGLAPRRSKQNKDPRCKFAPISIGCTANSHVHLSCLHCGQSFCPNCLFSEDGTRLRSPLECGKCGLPPRSLPNVKPRTFSPRTGHWLSRDSSLFAARLPLLPHIKGAL